MHLIPYPYIWREGPSENSSILNFWECSAHRLCQRHGICTIVSLTIRILNGYTVYIPIFYMLTVVRQLILYINQNQQETRHAHSQPGD